MFCESEEIALGPVGNIFGEMERLGDGEMVIFFDFAQRNPAGNHIRQANVAGGVDNDFVFYFEVIGKIVLEIEFGGTVFF